jgi:hypothetical protein
LTAAENGKTASRVGEVTEASSAQFVAQCYELNQPPPLGSLVKTKAGPVQIYGVVFNARTGSIEQGRHPIARGREGMEEEDIYRQNPQLAKLLRTDFEALVVGFREEGLHQYLPPFPAHLHSFVYLCGPAEIKEFTTELDFLNLLSEAKIPVSVDEIMAASLRRASLAQDDVQVFLVRAGRELARLLGTELPRLNALLKRLK